MADTQSDPQSLELRDYARVLWRWKGTIIVTTILVTAAAVGFTFTQDKVYESSSEILVEPSLSDRLTATEGAGAGVGNLQNELQLMKSQSARSAVREELGRNPEVDVALLEQTSVIRITADANTAAGAAADANDFANTYIVVREAQVQEELALAQEELAARIGPIDLAITDLDTQVTNLTNELSAVEPELRDPNAQRTLDNLEQDLSRTRAEREALQSQVDNLTFAITSSAGFMNVITAAGVPDSPVEPKPIRTGLLGFALGLVLGIALAFLREYLDDTVKTKEDVERATGGLNVVGLIPTVPEWKDKTTPQVASMVHPGSPAAEAYRTLRTSIQFLGLEEPIRTLQVTSASAVEAKTTTVANLAVTLATAGRRVIILCCDLRRPRIHEFFGLSHQIGFTSVLLGEQPLSGALQPVDAEGRLMMLASGPPPPNPSELLASERTAEVIESLTARCDLLLIDSPPVLPVTDAIVLSGFVDATMLVAYSGSTRKRSLRRAVEVLRQVDAPLIGCVLNGARPSEEYGYQYGYHPDAPSTTKGSRRQRKRQAKAARKSRGSATILHSGRGRRGVRSATILPVRRRARPAACRGGALPT